VKSHAFDSVVAFLPCLEPYQLGRNRNRFLILIGSLNSSGMGGNSLSRNISTRSLMNQSRLPPLQRCADSARSNHSSHPKEPRRDLSLVRLGADSSWAKNASVSAQMINARS
jgi:hypothetical protein